MSTQPLATPGAGSEPAEPVVVDPELEPSPTPEPEPVEPETPVEPEATPEPGSEPEPTQDGSVEDGRKLPGYIRALKETDPKAFAKAKTEFFDLSARRAVHATVQAAREEHELIASNGGVQGIAKLREDGQFFKSAATQFLKGDPAFVKDLWDEDPIAAALHVPIMLDSYREKDKTGYNGTICKLWKQEFQAVGLVDKGLRPLRAAILAGNKEEASAILDSIEGWQQSISAVADQAEDPRVKTLLAERAKQHETREQQEREGFIKTFKSEAINAVVEDGAKVFDSHFKDRLSKMDKEDRTDLLREAFRIADAEVRADKEFVEQREAHLATGDATAALRLTRARYARVMDNAVKRVARRYGLNAGSARPTTQIDSKPNGGTPPPTQQGFVNLNSLPNPDDIDRVKSTKEMLRAGRAVLKNGRKVSWAHLRAKVA